MAQTSWDDVPLLLACARTGSLSRAGRALGLDVSTASRRLAALEARLGLTLFERTRGGLVPTGAARALLPAAEEAERGIRHLWARAGAYEAQAEGVVRISTAPGLADLFLAPVLAKVRRRHPGLAFEVDASIRPVDLARGEADLALRSLRPESGELIVTRLLTARWVVAASPAMARALGRVEDWSRPPWIGWGADLAHLHAARWLATHAPGVTPVVRTSHFATQLAAAREGLGVALVAEPYLEPAGLVPVGWAPTLATSVAEWPEDPLFLVTHRALRHDPRVAAVWEALVEGFRGG